MDAVRQDFQPAKITPQDGETEILAATILPDWRTREVAKSGVTENPTRSRALHSASREPHCDHPELQTAVPEHPINQREHRFDREEPRSHD